MKIIEVVRQVSHRVETTEDSFVRYKIPPHRWYEVSGMREIPVDEELEIELENEYQIYKDLHSRIITEKK